jgi:replicative DNA helicase
MKIDLIPDLEKIKDFTAEDEVVLLSEAVKKNSKKELDYYATGFTTFDKAINGGLTNGQLVVVSGRSGEGKTSWCQTLTYNFSKQALPCLWFSYEVDLEHLWNKFVSMGIDDNFLTYIPLKMSSGVIDWIEHKIKEAILKYQTKMIFIDHLGFLLPALSNYDSEISKNYAAYLTMICRQIKNIARNLGVIIFLCAHIKKTKDELQLEDLANSYGIGQEADIVFMIERQRNTNKYLGNDDNIFTNYTNVKIVKNRPTGQTKIIRCQMVNEKFIELTKNYDEPKF